MNRLSNKAASNEKTRITNSLAAFNEPINYTLRILEAENFFDQAVLGEKDTQKFNSWIGKLKGEAEQLLKNELRKPQIFQEEVAYIRIMARLLDVLGTELQALSVQSLARALKSDFATYYSIEDATKPPAKKRDKSVTTKKVPAVKHYVITAPIEILPGGRIRLELSEEPLSEEES